MTQTWQIQTTVSSAEEAERIAYVLINQRLAACVQIDGPIRSLYRWEGQLHQDTEWRLTIKTLASVVENCEATLQREHPYQVPEILSLAIDRTATPYAAWLCQQLAPPNFHVRLVLGQDATNVSFEELIQRLSALPRLHAELDGSFVWRSSSTGNENLPWQLDGMIYDRHGQIEFIELKGNCDRHAWDELCNVCGLRNLNTIRVQPVSSEQGFSALEFSGQLRPR